ncbi:MAG: alkene reductase [Candidatus Promineifilaceae bacterium]
MTQRTLFTPITVGDLQLPNRIIMAPLTRNRAGEGNVPHALNADYYRQRASAGLIISEATQVTPVGAGYPNTPGIYSDEQVEGWRLVTDAVHEAGGRIFLQLWHVGRISHPTIQPNGQRPVAPSAIAPTGNAFTPKWERVSFVQPRALELDEIPSVVQQYADGAARAKDAGFDGVQIHGANSYLIDQFLRDNSNQRTDKYGGPIENRARFLREVVEAVINAWGTSERVSLRLSPGNGGPNQDDSDPTALFTYVAEMLEPYNLCLLDLFETTDEARTITPLIRERFSNALSVNGGYDRDSGNMAVENGSADAAMYGKLFISNPDLVERFRQNTPLNEWNNRTFYGGGAKGYTDYPSLEG